MSEQNIWLFKFSIGPGPSYTGPWGNPGPRDYYVTGVYKPFETAEGEGEGVSASEVSTTEFTPFPEQYAAAMDRDERTSLDPGAFYASKSFFVPGGCASRRCNFNNGGSYSCSASRQPSIA